MPTRSTGCLTCRKRKVRCDEARPGCKRCATHRTVCPGYLQDLEGPNHFMDETAMIIKRVNKQYGIDQDSSLQGQNRSVRDRTSANSPWTSSSSNSSDDETALVPSWMTPNSSFMSPEAERVNLHGNFISIHLPAENNSESMSWLGIFSYLATHSQNNPALRHGMNALSLVQVGSLQKDKRLVRRGQAEYGAALQAVARDITRGDNNANSDELLAAVNLLATCEMYGDIGNAGGWLWHRDGIARICAARGPDSLSSELANILFDDLRHGAVVACIIERRASFLEQPQWRAKALQRSDGKDRSVLFYDSAVQVPGILERFDKLDLQAVDAIADVSEMMADTVRLTDEMREFYESWQPSSIGRNGRMERELVPIEVFSAFTSICADRTLDYAYMFGDFFLGYIYCMYWMCLFHLRRTLQGLHAHMNYLCDWLPEEEDAVPEAEIFGYMLDMCRCIPFFRDPTCATAGAIATFLPLRTAAIYFVEHGHWQWMKWLGAWQNKIYDKGLNPPTVGDRAASIVSTTSAIQGARARGPMEGFQNMAHRARGRHQSPSGLSSISTALADPLLYSAG